MKKPPKPTEHDNQKVDWAIRTTPAGGRYVRHPNGMQSTVDPEGNRRDTYPDGTSRERTAHGGEMITLAKEPSTLERLLGKRRPPQMALDVPPSHRR